MADPDALSHALMAQWPELAGHVHYVNGRPWCDGINHTTMCDPRQVFTPSADLPACRDEDPAHAATLAAAYPDPPDYQHPEDDWYGQEGARLAERDSYIGTWSHQDVTKRKSDE